jgi:2-dehydropantoate 2-reductase
MRVVSLGAGAIGGYYGGRLLQAGGDVSFLVRPQRLKLLREHGLNIKSPAYGDYAHLSVSAFTAEQSREQRPFDVVMLTCKAYDLDTAMDSIAPFVEQGATILPLLNGLAHLEILNRRFGQMSVWGGLAKIAATLLPDGTIQHLNDWRYVTFGAQDGAIDPRLEALKEAFDRTNIVATLATDVMARMWEKFVHLATVASMTCLMRASVGEIARTTHGSGQMLEMFTVMVEMAKRAGYPVSKDFEAEYYDLFRNKASGYTASMLRDLEKGGRIEADHIIGFADGKAREFAINAPVLSAAFTHVKAYEERRASRRL